MKILIVDDSEYKVEAMRSLLAECCATTEVIVARSFQGGLARLEEECPDLVLLDMTLPTSEREDGQLDGRDRLYGGKELLGEMDLIELDTSVILVSQFDHFGEPPHSVQLGTLTEQLKLQYPSLFVDSVYYSNVDSRWRERLRTLIASWREGVK